MGKRREGLRIPIGAVLSGARSIWVDAADLPEILGQLSPQDREKVLAAAEGRGDLEAARGLLVQAALQWAARKVKAEG